MKKIILAILIGIFLGTSMTYAISQMPIDVSVVGDYHSHTKVLVVGDKYGNKVILDFLVECEGDRILNISSLGHFYVVSPEYDKEPIQEGWCP